MSPDEVAKLTPEEKCARIARLSGLLVEVFCMSNPKFHHYFTSNGDNNWSLMKDYVSSHDALFPVLARLTDEQWLAFKAKFWSMLYKKHKYTRLLDRNEVLPEPALVVDALLIACC